MSRRASPNRARPANPTNPRKRAVVIGLQFTVEDVPDLTIPADTILKARLEDIKLHEFEYTDKQNPSGPKKQGAVLQWWFEVTDQTAGGGKWATRKVKGETDAKISNHPRNKFRQWAEVMLDRELPPGLPIDTDDLVGLPVQIVVEHEADKKDPAKSYERVTMLLPAGDAGAEEIPF